MDNVRTFLINVETMAELYGINDLFVIADDYSITRNNNNEAIRRCRQALVNYEKEIGNNPEEDWRK